MNNVSGDDPTSNVIAFPKRPRVRPKTEPTSRMPQRHLKLLQYENRAFGDYDRPLTRGDCLEGGMNEQRPCPYVGCKYHLYLDVQATGNVRMNFVGREIEDLEHTCALDVADDGGATLESVAQLLSISRERIRQIEDKAMRKLKARAGAQLREYVGAEGPPLAGLAAIMSDTGGAGGGVKPDEAADDASLDLEDAPVGATRIGSARSTESDDCRRVYAVYDRAIDERDVVARGERVFVKGPERGVMVPVSIREARILIALRDWPDAEKGPTLTQLGERAGITGNHSGQSVRSVLLGLGELRAVSWSRKRGARIEPDAVIVYGPAPTMTAALPVSTRAPLRAVQTKAEDERMAKETGEKARSGRRREEVLAFLCGDAQGRSIDVSSRSRAGPTATSRSVGSRRPSTQGSSYASTIGSMRATRGASSFARRSPRNAATRRGSRRRRRARRVR